jgi:hypothetical protein
LRIFSLTYRHIGRRTSVLFLKSGSGGLNMRIPG